MDAHPNPLSPAEFDRRLGLVIAATGVNRYRYLATEQPDPVKRAEWRRWVLEHPAAGGAGHAPPAQESPSRPCGPCGKPEPQRVIR